jgi:NADH dehydrogenase (ubiquinone) 1 alpha subcomplex subunit 9
VSNRIRVKEDAGRASNNVAVTVFGGTGFTGQYVIGLLARIGCQVIIPYRGDGYWARELKLNGDLGQIVNFPCDLKDNNRVRQAVNRSDCVINLLGDWKETVHYTFHDSHVKTAYRIAKHAKEAGVQRFVHVSAMGASYDSPSDFLKAKAESEDVVRDFFPDAVILRPNFVHGETDRYLDRQAEFCLYSHTLPVINNGEALCQPLFVHDFANAVMNAMTYSKAAGNTYELAGPEVFTQREVAEFVMEYCRFPYPNRIVSLPLPVAKVIGKVVNKLPWQRWRYLTEDIAIRHSTDIVPSSNTGTLSIEDLGITPQTLNDSAVHALNVFRAEYVPLHGMDSATETGRNY